ncbi:MAG: prepilin-type N-terminal cleavage/methylation domain-containing protein [Candidatus Omnitrophica bacterium]|nr:prepilin-type N-terminal cleavage/methylation domain-containing protein [Candidatus Omnitrophota bacterium]
MKAFTLIEILVTILIFSFIVGGIYGVLNISKTNYDTNLISLNLQRQTRQGMSWLSREIRQARLSTIGIEEDGNNNDIITFNTLDATGIKYYVETTQLKREYPTGTVEIRANDIIALSFPARSAGSNLQKITLEASKTFFSGGNEHTLTFPLTEQVTVRNP